MELDHVVHFIKRNPQEAVDYLESYGVKAVRGGSHRTWGTYNSLLYIGHSYIEYFAVENPDIAAVSDNPLVKQLLLDSARYEGLGQICFRTHDISLLKEQLLAKGFVPSTIFEGSRERDDGITIRWKMLFVLNDSPLPYPFFIEWGQSDEHRINELKEIGFLPDEQEKKTIHSIIYVVNDAEARALDWSRLFNETAEKNREDAIVKIGGTNIIFQSATNSELKKVLNLHGERPYLIDFNPSLTGKPLQLFGALYS